MEYTEKVINNIVGDMNFTCNKCGVTSDVSGKCKYCDGKLV